MQDAGCGMPASSPSPASRRGGTVVPMCNGKLRSPIWPRSQRGWKQEPSEKSGTYIHTYSIKPGNLLPIYGAFRGGKLCGKSQEGRRTFLQGGGRCFPSLSQEPPMEGQKCPLLPAPGVDGGLRTTVAQVKTQRHSPRKAHTVHTIPLPLWPGRLIHPYRSKQHLH